MRPAAGEVLHFSEDPRIQRFVPHRAPTSKDPRALVWAVGAERAPDYWFPRQCPRALLWTEPGTSSQDADLLLGPGCGSRLHVIEYGWLERMQQARVYGYRLPADRFEPVDSSPNPHAVVSSEPVTPLGDPEPLGDLLALHESAGIQLRLLPNLWALWDAVVASTIGFSGIRLGNARPRV